MPRRARPARPADEPLQPDSPVPPYQQLATRLKAELAAGRFAAGDRWYPDSVLVTRFGVAQPVARQAVRVLVDAGLIAGRRSGGRFVTDRVADLRAGG